jgi:hypothetical protein
MRRYSPSELDRAKVALLYLIISGLCAVFILFGIVWAILLWKSS